MIEKANKRLSKVKGALSSLKNIKHCWKESQEILTFRLKIK